MTNLYHGMVNCITISPYIVLSCPFVSLILFDTHTCITHIPPKLHPSNTYSHTLTPTPAYTHALSNTHITPPPPTHTSPSPPPPPPLPLPLPNTHPGIIHLSAIAKKAGLADSSIINAKFTGYPKVKPPEIRPFQSTFAISATLVFTCDTVNATIYYTTDGSDPTLTSFIVESGSTVRKFYYIHFLKHFLFFIYNSFFYFILFLFFITNIKNSDNSYYYNNDDIRWLLKKLANTL